MTFSAFAYMNLVMIFVRELRPKSTDFQSPYTLTSIELPMSRLKFYTFTSGKYLPFPASYAPKVTEKFIFIFLIVASTTP